MSTLNVDGEVNSIDWHENLIAAGCRNSTIKVFDAQSGDCLSTVPEGFTFPKEGGARERRINSYVVAAKGQTLVIHKAPEDKAETAADGKAGTETPVAFFQCASNIAAFDVAGANVAVGCADGQVLQLFAAVLQP